MNTNTFPVGTRVRIKPNFSAIPDTANMGIDDDMLGMAGEAFVVDEMNVDGAYEYKGFSFATYWLEPAPIRKILISRAKLIEMAMVHSGCLSRHDDDYESLNLTEALKQFDDHLRGNNSDFFYDFMLTFFEVA